MIRNNSFSVFRNEGLIYSRIDSIKEVMNQLIKIKIIDIPINKNEVRINVFLNDITSDR
jgi:hypothetical protein